MDKNITREALLEAIRKKPLKINTCSLCGYECCFEFQGGRFGYDSGCDCVRYDGWESRPVEDLDFYIECKQGWPDILRKFVEGTDGA